MSSPESRQRSTDSCGPLLGKTALARQCSAIARGGRPATSRLVACTAPTTGTRGNDRCTRCAARYSEPALPSMARLPTKEGKQRVEEAYAELLRRAEAATAARKPGS